MDKAQLIKQEIESYKESMKGLEPHSDFRRGQITAFNHIMQFIDSLSEEPVSVDLEEEIEKYHESHQLTTRSRVLMEEKLKDIARHFAEWQKAQMMKDAVEGLVSYDDRIYGLQLTTIDLCKLGYKKEDKVKLIIIKKD